MITSTFPINERGLALGLNAVMVSLGVSAGPTLGGIITQYLTWRWIFYVNVPIGVLILLAGFYFYKEQRSQREQHERFDPLGLRGFRRRHGGHAPVWQPYLSGYGDRLILK